MISPKNRTEGFRGQRAIWKHHAMDESPALKQICPWKNPRLHLISHEAIGFEELARFFCHFQGFRVFAAQHVYLNGSADAPGSAPPGLPGRAPPGRAPACESEHMEEPNTSVIPVCFSLATRSTRELSRTQGTQGIGSSITADRLPHNSLLNLVISMLGSAGT